MVSTATMVANEIRHCAWCECDLPPDDGQHRWITYYEPALDNVETCFECYCSVRADAYAVESEHMMRADGIWPAHLSGC